jgi:uncharacterized membrane protein
MAKVIFNECDKEVIKDIKKNKISIHHHLVKKSHLSYAGIWGAYQRLERKGIIKKEKVDGRTWGFKYSYPKLKIEDLINLMK